VTRIKGRHIYVLNDACRLRDRGARCFLHKAQGIVHVERRDATANTHAHGRIISIELQPVAT
jgi:hypothetical protein